MKTVLPMLALVVCVTTPRAARLYHIGNSLTDNVDRSSLQSLAEGRGHEHVFGRHTQPGFGLNGLYISDAGNCDGPYGCWRNAFDNYEWDAVIVQPFTMPVSSDVESCTNFFRYARQNSNPDVTLYIYAQWPHLDPQYGSFEEQWYGNHWWSWSHYTAVQEGFEHDNPGVHAPIIPVGAVMLQLDSIMRSGGFPGYDSIWQVYNDGVHVGSMGSYVSGLTHYAVIYQEDPVGVGTYSNVSPEQAAIVEQVVHDVVLDSAVYTGVTAYRSYNASAVTIFPSAVQLHTSQSASLTPVVFPSNAIDRSVSWHSDNPGVVAVDDDGGLSPVSAGTTTVIATTTDGGHSGSCAVTIVDDGTPVDGVMLSHDSVSVMKDATVDLSCSFTPATPTNTDVIWHSLSDGIATVTNGVVTGVARGRTWVVALSVNGLHADTCAVRVTVPNDPPVAVLQAAPTVAYAGASVHFSGMASYDLDSLADDFVLGYDLDYGDGSDLSILAYSDHVYELPGTYHARLRVLDNNESRGGWDTVIIVIKEPEPDLLAYDGFEYADSSALDQKSSGWGWRAEWYVQAGDTSFPGYNVLSGDPLAFDGLAQNGIHARGGTNGYNNWREFDASSDGRAAGFLTDGKLGKAGTTLYFSAMLRKEEATDEETEMLLRTPWCCDGNWIGFGYSGQESNDGGKRYWSLRIDSTVYRTDQEVAVGSTAFFVLKLTFTESSTTADLFINPTDLGSLEPSTPTVSASADRLFRFNAVCMQTTSGGPQWSMDELRLGVSYASVTPEGSTRASHPTACGATEPRQTPCIRQSANGLVCTFTGPRATVRILDGRGRTRLVIDGARSGRHLPLESMAPGLYVVHLTDGQTPTARAILLSR